MLGAVNKGLEAGVRDEIRILSDDSLSFEKRVMKFIETLEASRKKFAPGSYPLCDNMIGGRARFQNIDSQEIIDYILPFFQKIVQRQMQHQNGDRYACDLHFIQEMSEKLGLHNWTYSYVDLKEMRRKLYEYIPHFIEFLTYQQVKDHILPFIEIMLNELDSDIQSIHNKELFDHVCKIVGEIYQKFFQEIACQDKDFFVSLIFRINILSENIVGMNNFDSLMIEIYRYLDNESLRKIFDNVYKKNDQKNSLYYIEKIISKLILENDDIDFLFNLVETNFDNIIKEITTIRHISWLFHYFANILTQKQLTYTSKQFDLIEKILEIPFNVYNKTGQISLLWTFLGLSQVNILEYQSLWQKAYDACDMDEDLKQSLVEVMARRLPLESEESLHFFEKILKNNQIPAFIKTGLFEGKFANETLNVEDPYIRQECIDFIKNPEVNLLQRFAALCGFIKHPKIVNLYVYEVDYFFLFLSNNRLNAYQRCIFAKDLLHKYPDPISLQHQKIIYELTNSLDVEFFQSKNLKNQILDLLVQRENGLENQANLWKIQRQDILNKRIEVTHRHFDSQSINELRYDDIPNGYVFEALKEAKKAISLQYDMQKEVSQALQYLDYASFQDSCHSIFGYGYHRIQHHERHDELIRKFVKSLASGHRDCVSHKVQNLLRILKGLDPWVQFIPDLMLEQKLKDLFSVNVPDDFTLDNDFTLDFVIQDAQQSLCKEFEEKFPELKISLFVQDNQHDHLDGDMNVGQCALDFADKSKKRNMMGEEWGQFNRVKNASIWLESLKTNDDLCHGYQFSEIVRYVCFCIKNHPNQMRLQKLLFQYIEQIKFTVPTSIAEKLIETLEGFYPDIRPSDAEKIRRNIVRLMADDLPSEFTFEYACADGEKMLQNQDGNQGDIDLALTVLNNIKNDLNPYPYCGGYSEKEVYQHVYYRIKNHENSKDLLKILKDELANVFNNCGTLGDGLLMTLMGFCPDISMGSCLKEEFFNAVKARLFGRIKTFADDIQEKFWDLLAKPFKERSSDDILFLEHFVEVELPEIAKELKDEYMNPEKADYPLTQNCFDAYIKAAKGVFLNLTDKKFGDGNNMW